MLIVLVRKNNRQSLVGANRDINVMQTMDFLIALLLDGRLRKLHVLYKNNSVRKIVDDGMSKTLVRALSFL